jgi:drug/metabolite transporter (DMT)-like permease
LTARHLAPRLLAILFVTAIWGWTFVVVKDAVAVFPVATFLAYRFLLAALIFLPFFRRINLQALRSGLLLGIFLGSSYLLQTIGLHFSLAADTGLITGLFVVFTPLLEWLIFRVRVGKHLAIGVGLALAGLILLVGALPSTLAFGDLLVAFGAVGFALHIVVTSHFAPRHDPISLMLGQTLSAGLLLTLAAATPFGGGFHMPSQQVWIAILITATLATALAFFVQTWVQRTVPATPTGIVLLTEPAWATLFGVWLSGNPFPPVRILGALLLFSTPVYVTLTAMRNRTLPERANVSTPEAGSPSLYDPYPGAQPEPDGDRGPGPGPRPRADSQTRGTGAQPPGTG